MSARSLVRRLPLVVVAAVGVSLMLPHNALAHHTVPSRAVCKAMVKRHMQQTGHSGYLHWKRDFRRCMYLRCRVVKATVKHRRANAHQLNMITRVLRVGSGMGANRKVLRSGIVTITQESTATNLAGGHGTSVGLFQIINIHGTWSQRHNPEWSARWYFSRAKNVNHWKPWLTIAQLAQAVQRSAYPSAYQPWVPESETTVSRYLRSCAVVRL